MKIAIDKVEDALWDLVRKCDNDDSAYYTHMSQLGALALLHKLGFKRVSVSEEEESAKRD